MQTHKIALTAILIGALPTNYVLGEQKDETAQARQAIQKIYNSPLYRSGTDKHPNSLRWPSSYTVDEKSFVELRIIKKFSLKDEEATVVVEYHDSVSVTDPATKKTVKIEAIDTDRDIWTKSKEKWASSQSRNLTSDYLIDGVPQMPTFVYPEKKEPK